MEIPAAPSDPVGSSPGSAAQWLAEHPTLAAETGAALLALVEPLSCWEAVKSAATGRYVFASTGLAQLFGLDTLVGRNDQDLLRPDEVLGLRRVEQAVMAQQHV